MPLFPAAEAEYPAIVALVNRAYRSTGDAASWNSEEGIVGGQRLDLTLLREELAANPRAQFLTFRDSPEGDLLGTVWLDPAEGGSWYLGLLTVRPDLQDRHLGRTLLAESEAFARERGATRIRMTVVQVRSALIAWYERRGYDLTGETKPFPYGDERFGTPLRDDLYFVVLEKKL